ncbi:MAG: M64 family metallopeptidase [Bacteroidales bacterium]
MNFLKNRQIIAPWLQFFILLSLTSASFTAHAQKKPQSLRIDYMHSGDAENEHFHIYKLIAEPYFSGHQNHLIYPFNYGHYKIEVRIVKTGKLVYSYHYNTLFNEWQTTKTAKTEARSFQESVKIPYPEQNSRLIFFARDSSLEWEKQHSYVIDPDSDFIIHEKIAALNYKKIHDSGPYKEKLDLVIIPDGYTFEEMEKFHQDALRFRDYLLNCDPFNAQKDKINLWRVDLASPQSGTDKPKQGKFRQTALNTSFNTFGTQRYLTPFDHFKVREIAACTPYDLIFILVNDKLYGGGGIFNFFSIATAHSPQANFLLIHEFGHQFAFLADEYYNTEVAVTNYHNPNKEPLEPNLTTLTDFSSKWKDLVEPETPIPTPAKKKYKNTVGVFEGGGYKEEGFYRPYMNCSMKSAQYNNFCPVCKQAIIKMFKYYTGEPIRP